MSEIVRSDLLPDFRRAIASAHPANRDRAAREARVTVYAILFQRHGVPAVFRHARRVAAVLDKAEQEVLASIPAGTGLGATGCVPSTR